MSVRNPAQPDSVQRLLGALVSINSVNPDLVPGAPGEHEVAAFVADWLRDAGVTVQTVTTSAGRPNVIGRAGDPARGRSLLLLAHTDTVSAGTAGPIPTRVEGEALHGRGSYDMKAGLAAAMMATARLARDPRFAGEIVLAAVCDEEAGGTGTRALLESGFRPAAAIVPEPSDLGVVLAHKGYLSFEIATRGRAAHGSRPDLGEDAILKMGPVLRELTGLDQRLQDGPRHPVLGTSSLHASLIEGGQEESSYPERAVLRGECRTIPGADVEPQLRDAIAAAGVDADVRILYRGAPFSVDPEERIVQILTRHARTEQIGLPYWTDAALLAAAGVPAVIYGPFGGGAHAEDEWVDLDSVARVADVLVATAKEFS